MSRAICVSTVTLSFLLLSTAGADARILTVGKGGLYALPSEAAQAAHAGDTIAIAPGTYTDCMNINVGSLTVMGTGAGVVLQNKTCDNKGIITVNSNNVTVSGLTLQGATSTDLNGAGIRGLGDNLTVLNTKFLNDQMGILATSPLANASTIIVKNSTFSGNGACGSFSGMCHSIYVGQIIKLDVENSTFTDQKFGHFIKSRARDSVINNNTIEDGTLSQSSYLIDIPDGGNVTITNNTLEKGPNAQNHCCAITMGEDTSFPLNPATQILVQDNHFTNDNKHQVIYVRNDTKTPAQLVANVLHGLVTPLTGPGSVQLRRLAELNSFLGDPRLFLESVMAEGYGSDLPPNSTFVLSASASLGAGDTPARISEPGGLVLLAGVLACKFLSRRHFSANRA
jgi:hypothetical protein